MVLAPAGLLCLLLVLHSARRRGVLNAAVFIVVGLPFFWLREIWAANEVMYNFQKGAVVILHVRAVGIVGWFFTSYCALAVVEDVLQKFFPRQANRVFITAGLTTFVSLAIATVVETAAQNMGWWTANAEGIRAFPLVFHGAQWFAPAWASTVIFFLLPYLMAAAFFKSATKMSAVKRVAAQSAVMFALLFVFIVVFMILLGSLSTVLLPAVALALGCIPFTARLRYL